MKLEQRKILYGEVKSLKGVSNVTKVLGVTTEYYRQIMTRYETHNRSDEFVQKTLEVISELRKAQANRLKGLLETI